MANLGITVDTSGVKTGTADLDALVPAAARAEAAVSKLATGTTQASQKITQSTTQAAQAVKDQWGQAANQVESMAQRIERALNIKPPNMDRGADIAAYGKALDDLRAKFNPLFAAEQQHIKLIGEIKQAHMVGAISTDEMSNAIQRETRAYQQLATAAAAAEQAARGAASVPQPGASGTSLTGAPGRPQQTGMQQMMQTNLMYQLQDIAVTTAMGMSPAMIALQQGTQIASVMAGAGGLKQGLGAIVGSLTSILSLSSLLPIAIVGIGAAFIQWTMGAGEKVKTLDELTKEHTKSVEALAKMYGVAGVSAQDMGAKAQSVIEAEERNTKRALVEGLKREQERLFGQVNPDKMFQVVLPGELGGSDVNTMQQYRVAEKYEAFAEPLEDLQKELEKGIVPDMGAFDAWINQIAGADPVLRKIHDDLVKVTAELRAGALAAGVNAAAMLAREQKLLALDRQSRMARTDAEKIEAARAKALDKYINMIEGEEKTKRILHEIDKARLDIEVQRADAAASLESKLTVQVKSAQDELDLMKLTGAEQEVRRQQIQEIRDIQEQARQAGVEEGTAEFAHWQKMIDLVNEFYEKILGIKRVQEEINQGNELAKLDADIQRMNARTDAERMSAAAAGAAAGVPAGDSTSHAIDLATRREAANIAKEQADATRDRHQALEDLVQTQKDEIELLNLEGGALEAAQEKIRLISEYRKQAAEHGRIVDQAEIDAIIKAADEMGRLVDQKIKLGLQEDLAFERSLIYMSDVEKEVAQRLRGTGIGTDSPEADMMRENIKIEEYRETARSTAKDFLSSMSDALVEGGEDMGENLVKAMVDSAQRTLDKILDRLLDDIIETLLFGGASGGGGASTGSGGLVDAFIKTIGGTGGGAAATDSTATSAVTTAADAVTKLAMGGGGSTGGNWLNYLNKGSTRNLPLSSSLIEDMSFLEAMGINMNVTSGGQPSSGPNRTGSHRHDWGNAADVFFTEAATGRTISQNNPADIATLQEIVSRASGAGVTGFGASSSYMGGGGMMHLGYGSKATWGHSLGHDTAPSWLTEAANNPISNKDFDRSVTALTETTDAAADATKAATKSTDLLAKAGADTSKVLESLGASSGDALNSLSKLAGGMGNLGGIMQSFMGSATGGGSDWFSGLSSLFGGVGGAIGHMTSISPAATLSILSGGVGLFHDGNMGSSGRSRYFATMAPWANAPRLHNGNMFAADEYPAVLRQGEPVFPSMAAAQATMGGKTIVNVHNYAGADVKTKEEKTSEGVTIDVMVDRMVASNIDQRGSASNNAMRSKFGMNERLRVR